MLFLLARMRLVSCATSALCVSIFLLAATSAHSNGLDGVCDAVEAGSASAAQIALGQMILHGYSGQQWGDRGVDAAIDDLAAGRIGGVLLLERNLASASQLRRLTADLQSAALFAPALIAVDQEGGAVQRLDRKVGVEPFPSARTMGRADVPGELVSLFFDDMARSLADLEINLNLAPVVDLDFGRGSPVIGRLERAFSSDPAVVADRARLFVRAHRRHGIATTLKHFPGHGSALRDSHGGLPDVSEVWVEAELRPFAALIRSAHADSVMLAHLVHPRLSDASRRPTSLSARAVNALRLQLGFDGPILTDALDMEAITGEFSVEEAAVEAIMSGVDVVIVAADRNPRPTAASELHAALIDAFEAGRLDPVGIAASCRRIASWRAALAQ